MITQTIWFAVRANRVIWYPNCRDCGKPIPPERWELGLCETHWRLFTRNDNPKQRREELGKPAIESLSILDDISARNIQFDFASKTKPVQPREKITRPDVELPELYSAKPSDENSKNAIQSQIKQAAKSKSLPAKAAETSAREGAEIQRRIDLVVAAARKRNAEGIEKTKAERETK